MQQPGKEENGKASDDESESGANGMGRTEGTRPALVPQDDPTRPGKANAFMPMYIGDMVRDTLHLSHAEFGAYHLLIYHYWDNKEPLPDDDVTLMRITRCTRAQWKGMRPTLSKFFQVDAGIWRHKRIDAEMAKAARAAQRRSDAGRRGNAKRWGEASKPNGSAASPDRPPSQCDPEAIAGSSQSQSEPESKPQPGRVPYTSMVPASGRKKGEDELMRRCRDLLGEAEMTANGGLWRTRAREDGNKLSRTLDELATQIKEGRSIPNRAGYLTDLYKNQFASRKQENN